MVVHPDARTKRYLKRALPDNTTPGYVNDYFDRIGKQEAAIEKNCGPLQLGR